MASPITPDMIAAARTAGDGRIDVATLIDALCDQGMGEFEAADHVVAIGCDADRAHTVALARIVAFR